MSHVLIVVAQCHHALHHVLIVAQCQHALHHVLIVAQCQHALHHILRTSAGPNTSIAASKSVLLPCCTHVTVGGGVGAAVLFLVLAP